MIKFKLLAEINADTVKAQSADWLTTDFQPTRSDSLVRITVSVSTAVLVLLAPSSGSNLFLGGVALSAGYLYTFEHQLDPARTWNMQTNDAAGTTVTHLRIIEVFDE